MVQKSLFRIWSALASRGTTRFGQQWRPRWNIIAQWHGGEAHGQTIQVGGEVRSSTPHSFMMYQQSHGDAMRVLRLRNTPKGLEQVGRHAYGSHRRNGCLEDDRARHLHQQFTLLDAHIGCTAAIASIGAITRAWWTEESDLAGDSGTMAFCPGGQFFTSGSVPCQWRHNRKSHRCPHLPWIPWS